MDILKLKPATKDYLWGGNKLRHEYNKLSDRDKISESWELSAHKDGLSIIENGRFKGMDFQSYLKKNGNTVIGDGYNKDRFPVLIKFIDALKPLSIQVHPKDDYAIKNEGDFGKTEMWYILEAEEKSFLYYGFNKEISKDTYKTSIENGCLEDLLNKVYVKKGDVFFIEAGTVHAIGAGLVICEIQQNSNITYRVYDYKRKDNKGNERPLHIEKALEVSNLKPNKTYTFNDKNYINPSLTRLARSDYFDVFKGSIDTHKIRLTTSKKSFQSITIIEGSGKIASDTASINFIKGDSFYIPAGDGSYTLEGVCQFILTGLPLD